MKKVVLIALLTIGYIITAVDAKTPVNNKDGYEWLISEVEDLYEEDFKVGQAETMVIVYDKKGNEIISFKESAYDELTAKQKKKMIQSEFLFDVMGDKVYILAD